MWYTRGPGSSFLDPRSGPPVLDPVGRSPPNPVGPKAPRRPGFLQGGLLREASEEGGPLPDVVCGSPQSSPPFIKWNIYRDPAGCLQFYRHHL